ncbi:hypothetical protein DLJ54_06695 [Corynebacterium heidelbergense]|uniref:ComEC/Rec2-related protein domain-containing protein n=1 Tax=Corynebacterium heidelbergense TaxID=2055947 RepID=A0A364V536_9CORY|nr:hypothetical protein DLJ54_06695 [Corynebacterium heidelbergense]
MTTGATVGTRSAWPLLLLVVACSLGVAWAIMGPRRVQVPRAWWPSLVASAVCALVIGSVARVRLWMIDAQDLMQRMSAAAGKPTHFHGRAEVAGVAKPVAEGATMVPVSVDGVGRVPLFLRGGHLGAPPGSHGRTLSGASGSALPQDLQPGTVLDIAATVRASDRPALAPVTMSATRPPEVLHEPRGLWAVAAALRRSLRAACEPLTRDVANLVPGMSVGDTSHQDAQMSQDFLATGLSHLTAVSGANVTIVMSTAVIIATCCRAGRRAKLAVVAIALLCFVTAVGPDASVLRAGVMGSIGLIATWSSRWGDSIAAACAAVIILVLADPGLAVSYGFALSIAATLGIVVLAPLLYRPILRRWASLCERRWSRAPRVGEAMCVRAVGVAVAADLVTAPIIVHMTGRYSPVSVLANLAVLLAVPPITVLGLTAALVATVLSAAGFAPGIAAVLLAPAVPCAWWVSTVARTFSAVDVVHTSGGTWFAIAFVLVGVLLVWTLRLLNDARRVGWRVLRWGWMATCITVVGLVRAHGIGVAPYADTATTGWAEDLREIDDWDLAICTAPGPPARGQATQGQATQGQAGQGRGDILVAAGGTQVGCPATLGRPRRVEGESVRVGPGAEVWVAAEQRRLLVVRDEAAAVRAAEHVGREGIIVVTDCTRSRGRPSRTSEGAPVVFPCADGTIVAVGGEIHASGAGTR